MKHSPAKTGENFEIKIIRRFRGVRMGRYHLAAQGEDHTLCGIPIKSWHEIQERAGIVSCFRCAYSLRFQNQGDFK